MTVWCVSSPCRVVNGGRSHLGVVWAGLVCGPAEVEGMQIEEIHPNTLQILNFFGEGDNVACVCKCGLLCVGVFSPWSGLLLPWSWSGTGLGQDTTRRFSPLRALLRWMAVACGLQRFGAIGLQQRCGRDAGPSFGTE